MKKLKHTSNGAEHTGLRPRIKRWWNLARLSPFVALILIGIILPFVTLTHKAAALNGETFTWQDELTITVTGGQVQGTANLTTDSLGSNNVMQATGVVTLTSGCKMFVTIFNQDGKDPSKAKFFTSAPPRQAGTGGTLGPPMFPPEQSCFADPNSPLIKQYNYYDGTSGGGPEAMAIDITLANPANAKIPHGGTPPPPPTAPDPSAQQVINVRLDTGWTSIYVGHQNAADPTQVTDPNNTIPHSDIFILCSLNKYVNGNQGRDGTYNLPKAQSDCEAQSSDAVLQTSRGYWNLSSTGPGYNDGGSTIRYNTSFSNVTQGTYLVCDLMTHGCSDPTPVTKVGGKILMVDKWQNQPDPNASIPPAAGSVTAPKPTACDLAFSVEAIFGMKWLTCPIVEGLNFLTAKLDDLLNSQLNPDMSIFDNNGDFYKAWSSFRVIGLGIVVIAALVIVLAEAAGMQALSPYAIRKLLPVLLAVALAIGFSWPLLKFAFQASYDITEGIRTLIYAPFQSFGKLELGGGSSFSLLLLSAGGILILGWGVLLSFAATAALSVAVALVTFLLIHTAGYVLVITSPVWIACAILPGTRKVYVFCRDGLVVVLIVPIAISGGIAGMRVLAVVLYNSPGNTVVHQDLAFLDYYAADFLAGAIAIKVGGIVQSLASLAGNSSQGMFNRLKQGRGNMLKKRGQLAKEGRLYSGGASNPLNSITRGASTGFKGHFGLGKRGAIAHEQAIRAGAHHVMQTPEYEAIKHNDDALRAGTYANSVAARQGLMARGWSEERTNRAINAVHGSIGFGAAQQYAVSEGMVETGTAFGGYTQADGTRVTAMQDMVETLARASNGSAGNADQLAHHANSHNKNAARHDLAPGHHELVHAVNQEAGITAGPKLRDMTQAQRDSTIHTLMNGAANSADPMTWARDRTAGFNEMLEHQTTTYHRAMQRHEAAVASGNQREQQAAILQAQQAEQWIHEQEQVKMYTSGDNAALLHAAGQRLDNERDWLGGMGRVGAPLTRRQGNPNRMTQQILTDPATGKPVLDSAGRQQVVLAPEDPTKYYESAPTYLDEARAAARVSNFSQHQ